MTIIIMTTLGETVEVCRVRYDMGRPILYAHLILNHFTAAFSRYGTLLHFEDYKDPISNKYKK